MVLPTPNLRHTKPAAARMVTTESGSEATDGGSIEAAHATAGQRGGGAIAAEERGGQSGRASIGSGAWRM